ncbi:MAG: hypothetical protein LBH44_13755 [Treponema sp.]|jgi:hypothetical protein|nr:hypothetical protein [Treponema sp.]
MSIYLLIPVISISFCLFLFFYFKWYINKRTSASKLLSDHWTEVNKLIAQIDAATDRDFRLIEDRITKLKAILEDADKRIAVHEQKIARNPAATLYTNLGRGIRAALKPEQPQAASGLSKPLQFKPETENGAAERASPGHIRDQIETLIMQGIAPAEIASRLNISLSEVDLVMNLLGKSKTYH